MNLLCKLFSHDFPEPTWRPHPNNAKRIDQAFVQCRRCGCTCLIERKTPEHVTYPVRI